MYVQCTSENVMGHFYSQKNFISIFFSIYKLLFILFCRQHSTLFSVADPESCPSDSHTDAINP